MLEKFDKTILNIKTVTNETKDVENFDIVLYEAPENNKTDKENKTAKYAKWALLSGLFAFCGGFILKNSKN